MLQQAVVLPLLSAHVKNAMNAILLASRAQRSCGCWCKNNLCTKLLAEDRVGSDILHKL